MLRERLKWQLFLRKEVDGLGFGFLYPALFADFLRYCSKTLLIKLFRVRP